MPRIGCRPGTPIISYGSCRPKPRHEEECENNVHVNTTVSITQSADASGGNGGAGGNGGSAASAAASGEDASASASVSISEGLSGNNLVPEPAEAVNTLQEESAATATGGSGGDGGNGGIGGAATNTASVTIDNVIMICCHGKGPDSAIRLGMNERKVDITVDKDGNTLVNGKKMDEEELENGTKVFIFRNSEAKKTEA
jgi:hypothetical protein